VPKAVILTAQVLFRRTEFCGAEFHGEASRFVRGPDRVHRDRHAGPGRGIPQPSVMPKLVPGIDVFGSLREKDVDGRDKPGHDEGEVSRLCGPTLEQ
jgi:hypothetical protein